MKIFILMGSQGEYSDRTEWPIRAYASKEKAEAELLKADEEERIRRSKRGSRYSFADEDTFYFLYEEVEYDTSA